MMAQMSGISVTCGHALETHESSRIGRPSKPFIIIEVCGPQRAAKTCGSVRALLSREVRDDAVGHVTALEPS
jgi:hypothetical protein